MNAAALQQSIDEAIALAGGSVSAENCPSVLPRAHLMSINASLQITGAHFTEILAKYRPGLQGAIALTLSTAFACHIRKVSDDMYLLAVPIGVPIRLRVLARLLLRSWGNKRSIHFIRSALDKITPSPEAIPPLLRPLLLEDFSDEDLWSALAELDRTVELAPLAENDVQELVHLGLLYLLSHEFTHLLHGHFELLATPGEQLPMSKDELLRGLELDADSGGAAVAMWIMHRDVEFALERGENVSRELAWLRQSYAATMLYGIYEPSRRWFGHYAQGAYNHPNVRLELFFQCVEDSIDATKEYVDAWRVQSAEGFSRCFHALEDLNMRALQGEFGPAPKSDWGPLHALSYSATPQGITNQETWRLCREAMELRSAVRKLLPIFTQSAT